MLSLWGCGGRRTGTAVLVTKCRGVAEMTITRYRENGVVMFRSPRGVRHKHPRRRQALQRRLLQGVSQGGGMGPSTTGDLKVTGLRFEPGKVAIVRGEMKDIGLSLVFRRFSKI